MLKTKEAKTIIIIKKILLATMSTDVCMCTTFYALILYFFFLINPMHIGIFSLPFLLSILCRYSHLF